VEEGLHADAEGLVVAVHAGPDGGFAPEAGAADAGEDRADDLVADGEQGGDGAGRAGRDVVAPGLAGLDSKALAAELEQVAPSGQTSDVGVKRPEREPKGVGRVGEAGFCMMWYECLRNRRRLGGQCSVGAISSRYSR